MKITYRGWAGHFICADKCEFRLNTLIEHEDIKIVVSTVGRMSLDEEVDFMEIGAGRHFETMAFFANDTIYHDADVTRQVFLRGKWMLSEPDQELEANEMHEEAIEEIKQLILSGELKGDYSCQDSQLF